MVPKILRRCDVCKQYHVSYLAVDTQAGTRYYCYSCWKQLKAQAEAGSTGENPIADAAQVETQSRKE